MSDFIRGFLAGKIGSTSEWRREAASMLVPESQIPQWKKRVGPDFLHVHHYCFGLSWLSKAEDPENRSRAAWAYRQAVGEIDYTRSKSRPGAPLWEVMSIDYARALAGNGQWGESQAVFQDLLADNPSNSDIWVAYAKQLKRRRKLNDAIALLEQGLEKANKKGPLLYWLAIYQFDLGDLTRAAETTARAEAAGMKVDSLKRRLGRTAVPAAAD
ncbi:tetratricopeptide repeat protein [Thiohalocapsa sp. ML1]|uniref:tetratricopeptide repeat protein n=1 Tax=Thiohalocapsa sp. ML1 TaxID=1431688 RepID=UPI0012E36AE4|nr:tetratricopeptide repeat protein [Thiohalocapsa sp. ML1]